jgi:hypothetical protein
VQTPAVFTLAGAAIAALSVPLAALAGSPYLSLGSINPWIVTFAAGLFTALFAAAFAIYRSRRVQRAHLDERWERAAVLWGAGALAVLAVGALLGLPSGFDGDSLAGSLGLVTVGVAVLVVGTLLVVVLSG